MNARDLLVQSQKAYASSENLSASESIVVKHKDGSIENTRANVVMPVFNEKTKSYVGNKTEFRDVVLTKKPENGSLVQYGTSIWTVLESMGDRDIYNLSVSSGKQHSMGKKNRPSI